MSVTLYRNHMFKPSMEFLPASNKPVCVNDAAPVTATSIYSMLYIIWASTLV
jgi:hypothetical protein